MKTKLRTRKMPVVAQDPKVRRGNSILTATVSVAWEDLEPGPIGHRVCVIDYDASTRKMYEPAVVDDDAKFDPKRTAGLLDDPSFHARNVYALVMRTLGRFEYALGRRVGWGFQAHQLKVVPHAFEEMNAFYSREAESLVFGYYRAGNGAVFTCLSHDVVVHETAHALLDGLRKRFMSPSSPDQAAFHEAFGDVVALLSVFSIGEVLETLLEQKSSEDQQPKHGLIHKDAVSTEALMKSVLFGLAEEMGSASEASRAGALRTSVTIEPDKGILGRPAYKEAHNRGEILVAAVMRAFIDAWRAELTPSETVGDYLDLRRVAEVGARIADLLLTMAIRAIDYTPPIHISFSDYLSALITADREIRPDDSRYELRTRLREWFGRYGIEPASGGEEGEWETPQWETPEGETSAATIDHQGVHFQSLQSDPVEMFSLLWANRELLRLDPGAYTRVASVRPCVRVSPNDGLPLRETVAECIQYVKLEARHLGQLGLTPPAEMPPNTEVTLEGGNTLVFDEYGDLKYDIHNRLPRPGEEADLTEAQERLEYLWDHGAFDADRSTNAQLATLHRQRIGLDGHADRSEVW